MSSFSPGKLLHLVSGVVVPQEFPPHSQLPLESEQGTPSSDSRGELALLVELDRRWYARVAGNPWMPFTEATDVQNRSCSKH